MATIKRAMKKFFPGAGRDWYVERSSLELDLSKKHVLDLWTMRTRTGLVLTATLAAALWATVTAASTNVRLVAGELADANTKTSAGIFAYTLPDNYVAGAAITVRVQSQALVAGGDTIASNSGSDIDVLVYKQASGAIGSDLCTTAAQTPYVAAATSYNSDFVVTPTGLVAGDVLNIVVVGRCIEAGAEGGTLQQIVTEVSVLHNVQG